MDLPGTEDAFTRFGTVLECNVQIDRLTDGRAYRFAVPVAYTALYNNVVCGKKT